MQHWQWQFLHGQELLINVSPNLGPRQFLESSVGECLVCACRYRSAGVLLGMIRAQLKWAAVDAVKDELHRQLDAILGGMTEEDRKPPEKKKKKKPAQAQPQVSKDHKRSKTK